MANQIQDFLSGGIMLIIVVVTYLAFCIPLYAMGKKADCQNPWFAFVPILNVLLMLDIAGKDAWWILLYLIPCINIIINVIVWMEIAEAMDKPSWLGVLMLVPVLNWILPWYFAFG